MMWSVLYWVLLVLAVLVLLRGLLWDRAGFRGRPERRCRRCWYDLTGVDGDVSKGAVVCPECGKGHKSKRSMRRTRRGKWWIVGAVVLFFTAYSLQVTPAVKKRGWWAAAPSWVLIMGIHQTPTYVKNPDIEWGAIAYGNKSPLERAMRELQVRARVQGLSWFDYQLVAWLARTETEELLCQNDRSRYEGVSPRASSYCTLIKQGIQRGKLGSMHTGWFEQLLYHEILCRDAWPEKGGVYARVHTLFADRDRGRYGNSLPRIRIRATNNGSIGGMYTRRSLEPLQNFEPFAIGSERNLYFSRERSNDWSFAIPGRVWSDGNIPVYVSSKTGEGKLTISTSEVMGYYGAPYDREKLIDVRDVQVQVKREGTAEDYVSILDDEDVRHEIERCLAADGLYWFDMDGRWHAMFRLRLIDDPAHLGERRYTFGGDSIRSISANEELAGQAWWALEPDPDGGWRLIHGDEWVPMNGWADENIVDDRYPGLRNLSIKCNPVFCLRDDQASLVVVGGIRIQVKWKQAQVHIN